MDEWDAEARTGPLGADGWSTYPDGKTGPQEARASLYALNLALLLSAGMIVAAVAWVIL